MERIVCQCLMVQSDVGVIPPVIPVFWLTPQVALGDKTEVINASQQSLGVSLTCQF